MKRIFLLTAVAAILIVAVLLTKDEAEPELNRSGNNPETIGEIPLPEYYHRHPYDSTSYAAWLRNLPLEELGSPVHLYNGRKKQNQNAHYAVIDLDIGNRDLQQCADAVIRIRSEYLFAKKRYDEISFNFTSGDTASFRNWIEGYRPEVEGDIVTWVKSAWADSSYENFRKYLDVVFTYAGSYSLSKQLRPKEDINDIESGDIFVQGGFPGHAVIVVDMAAHNVTGEKIFLLAQSFMPAQDVHILKNPVNISLNPWYSADFGDSLITPEWVFGRDNLMAYKIPRIQSR